MEQVYVMKLRWKILFMININLALQVHVESCLMTLFREPDSQAIDLFISLVLQDPGR